VTELSIPSPSRPKSPNKSPHKKKVKRKASYGVAPNARGAFRPIVSPQPPVVEEPPSPSNCRGIYDIVDSEADDATLERFVPFVIRTMVRTAAALRQAVTGALKAKTKEAKQKLIGVIRGWMRSSHMLLPWNGGIIKKTAGGFCIRAEDCKGDDSAVRCASCKENSGAVRMASSRAAKPLRPHPNTRIEDLSEYQDTARWAIENAREEARFQKEMRMKAELDLKMLRESRGVSGQAADTVLRVIQQADEVIGEHYDDDSNEMELWKLHFVHLGNVAKKGKKTRGIRYHPKLLDAAIMIHAMTSNSTYEKLQEIFMLPDRSHICRKSAEMVATKSNTLRNVHTHTLATMDSLFDELGYPVGHFAREGKLSFDAVNANPVLEHDSKSNKLMGMDQSMSVSVVKGQFESMARSMATMADADASGGTETSSADSDNAGSDADANVAEDPEDIAIIDNLRMADQHLCFRWTSLHPDVKVSEIVATIDVGCVTPEVVSAMSKEVIDMMSATYGLDTDATFADDATENAKYAAVFSKLPAEGLIDAILVEEYKDKVDFSIKVAFTDLTTGNITVILPDMPHLVKNMVTAMELSSTPSSKRDLYFDADNPVNLNMIKAVWKATGGKSNQQQHTKLTLQHFEKNPFTRMRVYLAVQVLSNSVRIMLVEAVDDDSIKVPLDKSKYAHLIEFIEKMNRLVDICNGRDGNWGPDNGRAVQKELLDTLAWFWNWRKNHDERVKEEKGTEYNFFADATWMCIQRLLLGLVVLIEDLCIRKGQTIVPRRLNTDDLENHFANCRQFVGGSHDKLTVKGWMAAHAKASKYSLTMAKKGNNAFAPMLARKKRFF